MPITNLNPTVNTTPDQAGTTAVSGISNTGHTTTTTSASAGAIGTDFPDSQSDESHDSARWSSFSAGPGGLSGLRLKFEWTADGSVQCTKTGSGSGSASVHFTIEYTLDGGSNWISQVSKSKTALTNQSNSIHESGSETIDLSPTQNIALVQVRDLIDATANANAGIGGTVTSIAAIDTTISNIKLEAETPSGAGNEFRFLLGT